MKISMDSYSLCYKYLMLPKNKLFYTKEVKFLTSFWPCCCSWCFLFQKQPLAVKVFLRSCKNHRKHLSWSFCFNKVAGLQAGERDSATDVFLKFCKIFRKTYFVEHLWATASAFWRSIKSKWYKKILHKKIYF